MKKGSSFKLMKDKEAKFKRKDMAKLCARGKAAAKRKFKVYPSAYAKYVRCWCM